MFEKSAFGKDGFHATFRVILKICWSDIYYTHPILITDILCWLKLFLLVCY